MIGTHFPSLLSLTDSKAVTSPRSIDDSFNLSALKSCDWVQE